MIRLTFSRTRARRKAGRKKRRPGKRPRRLRVALALALVLFVFAAALLLHAYVSVTSRFDGRLWAIPSRIFSDVLALTPGERLSEEDVERRLERCGYARTTEAPARPGQFRRSGVALQVFLRGFSSPTDVAEARRLDLEFRDGYLVSLRDAAGRPLRRAVLEPELLATLYGARQEERRPIRLEQVPEGLIDAVLSAEDARFFSHHGLDLRGIARAGLANVRQGRIVQGGSTITQQTVKNLYLHHERTWWRKAREALLALVLDARYAKRRILEVYLNEVYLGQRGPVAICGIRAGALFYLGREPGDLSLGEWALLAGLIRSPGTYNPFLHPDRAAERRNQVLDAMLRLGHADESAVAAARREKLQLASGAGGFSEAPYAVDYVQAQLAERFPREVLLGEGLSVYTTVDTRLQQRAERVVREGLERLERQGAVQRAQAGQRELQGALVATRPSSGAILAMVGGRAYGQTQFNRVVQARRQPGSCFKPLVYAAGFELARRGGAGGLTPATLLEDRPLEMRVGGKTWRPSNYDGTFRGTVTARRALEDSLNVPTVRAAEQIGLDAVIATARRCGIRSELPRLPSLALGTAEVTPLELATAYGAFAQRGERIDPWIIRAVIGRDGSRLEGGEIERERAVSVETALQVDDLLEGVFERGTARSAAALGFTGRAAGKTGTTDETRDAWFVGYSGDLLALVWVGYDDNLRTGLTGATGALPLWVEFVGPDAARADRAAPPGMVRVTVCSSTGLRATGRCPEVRDEWFPAGSAPTRPCEEHMGRFRRWWRKVFQRGE